MTLAYGTPIKSAQDFEAAQTAAISKHSYYYTDAPGWLLRAVPVRYAAIAPYADPVTGDGEWYTTDPKIELFAFPVIRWTEHGATMNDIWTGRGLRWVDLRQNAKQWASRTAQEAVAQLALRRKRQLYILGKQTARAQCELGLAFNVLNGPETGIPVSPLGEILHG